jgi:hypothetical protein
MWIELRGHCADDVAKVQCYILEKIPASQALSWTIIWRDVRRGRWAEFVAGMVEKGPKHIIKFGGGGVVKGIWYKTGDMIIADSMNGLSIFAWKLTGQTDRERE